MSYFIVIDDHNFIQDGNVAKVEHNLTDEFSLAQKFDVLEDCVRFMLRVNKPVECRFIHESVVYDESNFFIRRANSIYYKTPEKVMLEEINKNSDLTMSSYKIPEPDSFSVSLNSAGNYKAVFLKDSKVEIISGGFTWLEDLKHYEIKSSPFNTAVDFDNDIIFLQRYSDFCPLVGMVCETLVAGHSRIGRTDILYKRYFNKSGHIAYTLYLGLGDKK